MSFVSHAQNYEDGMLRHELKHIQNGIYVDAHQTITHQVSKALYELG